MTTIDRMSFDGSCDPNPRGRMGWSYIIHLADGRTLQAHDELPPASANTVNVAEYRGLVAGLRAYLAAGGRGPLQVTGDSQLIINQVNGVYKIRKPELQPYHIEVSALARQIRGFSVEWNRREHNMAADMLARGEPRQTEGAGPDAGDLYVHDQRQAELPAEVRAAIDRLNRHPAPGFKDLAGLRSGGIDAFSKLVLAALQERVGATAADQVAQALDDPKAQAAALRWVLRGLGVQRAIRKVQVDAEIAASAQRPVHARTPRFRRS